MQSLSHTLKSASLAGAILLASAAPSLSQGNAPPVPGSELSNAEVQDEHASFVHAAGDVVLILDGWREAVSPFTVTVTCTDAELPDTGLDSGLDSGSESGLDTSVDTSDTRAAETDSDSPGPADPRGCGSVPIAPGVLWLTAIWALRPTRRPRKAV